MHGWAVFVSILIFGEKDGVYVALTSLFRRARAVSQNLRRPDGERRVTTFLHLAETASGIYRPGIAQFTDYLVARSN